MDGVSHTVEVTAATLYEAVAQGLVAIRANEWVAGIAQGLNVVNVSVADARAVGNLCRVHGVVFHGQDFKRTTKLLRESSQAD